MGGVGWFVSEVGGSGGTEKCDYVELCLFKQEKRRRQLEGMYIQR